MKQIIVIALFAISILSCQSTVHIDKDPLPVVVSNFPSTDVNSASVGKPFTEFISNAENFNPPDQVYISSIITEAGVPIQLTYMEKSKPITKNLKSESGIYNLNIYSTLISKISIASANGTMIVSGLKYK